MIIILLIVNNLSINLLLVIYIYIYVYIYKYNHFLLYSNKKIVHPKTMTISLQKLL